MALYAKMAFKATQGKTPYKYLCVVGPKGSLEYAADGVVQLGTKFAMENSPGNLVHIRSCENNKYWVRDAKDLIVAQAVEPVVDRKSPGCTLFSISMDNNNRATFTHVQSGRVVSLHVDSPVSSPSMILSVNRLSRTPAVSAVVDYDGLVILPKFVAFKGSNGLYYKNSRDVGFTEREIGNPEIVCECQYSTDGHLRVKIARQDSCWTALGKLDTIVMGFPSNPTDVRQMFEVIKVANNVIALRSRLNNLICMRAPVMFIGPHHLVAKSKGMVNDARLEIVEPLFRREVTVEFDLNRARIYNAELLFSRVDAWDNSTDVAQSGTADGRITTSKSRTYTNNITISTTVTTTFTTGIPFIVEGKVEVSATASYSHEWAQTITEEQSVGHSFTVVVVPKKTTRARGAASKAQCDVPFSYVQRDYPSDGGPPRVTRLSDGVFTGANAYNFRSEVWYDDLPTFNGPRPTKVIKRIEPHKG